MPVYWVALLCFFISPCSNLQGYAQQALEKLQLPEDHKAEVYRSLSRTYLQGYENQILTAKHRNWNRSGKIGYRILKELLKSGEFLSYQPFIDGWLQDNDAVWGRPVNLPRLSDGLVLISDDHKSIIYHVTYNS